MSGEYLVAGAGQMGKVARPTTTNLSSVSPCAALEPPSLVDARACSRSRPSTLSASFALLAVSSLSLASLGAPSPLQ
eukprot:4900524-Pleurochrysis_carterae.AAC.3